MTTWTTGTGSAAIPLGQTAFTPALARAEGHLLARYGHLIALAGLTAIGAAMRFYNLARPTLLSDEGATFSRVNGSYYEMLEYLQYDGFPPIHYQLYWLLGRVTYLDPFMMRLIPATAGVLMIPAMYFTARQILSKNAALLASLIVVTSAWMMAYSRDAKMYMLTWFLVTMAMGCLFCWLRTDRKLAWLGWVFFALASVGTHASAMILVAFMPLYVIVSPRFMQLRLPRCRSRRAAWFWQLAPPVAIFAAIRVGLAVAGVWPLWGGGFGWPATLMITAGGLVLITLIVSPWLTGGRLQMMALGLAAVITGPGLYYYFFNKWIARTGGIFSGVTVSASAMEGLMIMGATLIVVLLMFPLVSGRRARLGVVGAAVVLSLVAGGLFYRGSGSPPVPADGVRIAKPMAEASQADPPDGAAAPGDDAGDPKDEFTGWGASGLMWLRVKDGPRTLMPSVSMYFTGWHWPDNRQWDRKVRGGVYAIPRVVVYGAVTLLSVLAVAGCLALFPWPRRWAVRPASAVDVAPGDRPNGSIGPRGAPESVAGLSDGADAAEPGRPAVAAYRGALWLAFWVMMPLYGFYYCRSIKGFVPPWHWLEVSWSKAESIWLPLLGVSADAAALPWGERVWLGPGGVPWWLIVVGGIAVLAAGLLRWWLARLAVLTVLAFTLVVPLKAAITDGGWYWLAGYVAALFEPWRFGVLTVCVPALALYHGGPDWKARGVRSLHVAYVVVVLLACCAVMYLFWSYMAQVGDNRGLTAWLAKEVATPRSYEWKPLWTPRYVGIIWPAVAILTAWLIMRLPGWPLRVLVIAALVSFNLGSAVARITVDTQPRLDRMAADVWDANDHPDDAAVFFFNGHGGRSWHNPAKLNHWTGSYYLCNHKQIRPSPHEIRGGWFYGRKRWGQGNAVPNRLDHKPPQIHFHQMPDSLAEAPGLGRVVVWTLYHAGPQPDMSKNTALQDALGPSWQLVSDEFFSQWGYREWIRHGWTRRREYTRVEAPAPESPGAPVPAESADLSDRGELPNSPPGKPEVG